ncbi:response regulator transcription factor, partial [Klebsiella pneumoniae]|uniref:response regulator transcription factor n=1 Tax=Klebsiella pneumoniae TaxID=573 RepID=UPI003EE22375
AGVEAAKALQPDLILLDVDLPDFDGRDACRKMREEGVVAPIIMLTAATTDDDTIMGLDAGADDYVPKPFKFAVLLARIRA